MAKRAPEGPKAHHTAEQATGGYIQKPPSPEDLARISEAQAQITDEWTGEPPLPKKPSAKP
ncbi:hypothetical protein CR162_08650 [Pseudoroseomonas rhizosphaerae]|uniref:Uncharacterized protein n=1 Tax=Teichococcus rhizosphaerae TaxID=1335062 RepID=A0A2C7ACS2_9PROT|nr:hypothetical protein [Pseudoroseomonas rhizosphaerae]PHK95235.1 hypothetical protein CR162_08650 [Pseudoroseomonas rhizosphaerae]